MTSTHGLVGALLGVTVAIVRPDLAPAALVVGFAGGVLPDADLLATHRRSFHFPVYATVGSIVAVSVAHTVGTPITVLCAVFAASFALHCLMDAFGGGVELRPWEATSERGVYNHVTGRWITPRRWVRYAGAPEDFLLAFFAALPVIALTGGHLQRGVIVIVVLSGIFTALRRCLPVVTERLFGDTVP